VGHESEVPQPGDYITRQLGLQPVIIVRDKEGVIQLLLNRCMHRGNLVCESERGNVQELRCIYHGWTYSTKGDLLGAPYSAAYGAAFRKEDYGLAKVPRVGSYRGFIFASLSPTGISLDEHLGYAKGLIDQFVELSPAGEVELCAGTQKQRYRGNWKMQVENAVDNYHTTFIHQTANDLMKRRTGMDLSQTTSEQSPALSRYLGGGHALFDFRPLQRQLGKVLNLNNQAKVDGTSGARKAYVQALEKRYGRERAQEILQDGPPHGYIFPNLIFIQLQVRRIQPMSASETAISYQPAFLTGVPAEINTARLREHEWFFGPAGFGSPDDLDIFERQQLALQARLSEWLVLRRGLHRERLEEGGIKTGHIADEGHVRGIWQHYRQLMMQP
ncbi:MAG TPA: aromatic ring-hydroxylating dioxygenase subunit alpha, partial [Candidatus Binatia bacterium]|nr:aromatic ring-hydroxylating dioxygenase subunit alpha [Candidatus Binatia bacterium]